MRGLKLGLVRQYDSGRLVIERMSLDSEFRQHIRWRVFETLPEGIVSRELVQQR